MSGVKKRKRVNKTNSWGIQVLLPMSVLTVLFLACIIVIVWKTPLSKPHQGLGALVKGTVTRTSPVDSKSDNPQANSS